MKVVNLPQFQTQWEDLQNRLQGLLRLAYEETSDGLRFIRQGTYVEEAIQNLKELTKESIPKPEELLI